LKKAEEKKAEAEKLKVRLTSLTASQFLDGLKLLFPSFD